MNTRLLSVISSVNKGLLHFSIFISTIIPIVIDLWVTNVDQKSVRLQNWNLEYDIIIVGAGTAGALIANQLVTQTNYNVLLLEAGGNHNLITETPALGHLLRQTSLDWQFETEPQDNACLGLDGRRSRWPSGKVVGGSSAIGDMIYTNGNPNDFVHWEQLGVKGWTWNDVKWEFPLFEKDTHKKGMTKEDIDEEVEQRIEENLSIGSGFNKQVVKAFKQTARQLNYTFFKFNTKSEIGFSRPLLSVIEGRRYSTAEQFLRPVLKTEKLTVVNYAVVDKIIFDNMTATSVRFNRFGSVYTIKANEIILSAGTVNSAKILMKSGIGPKSHLESLKIPVIKDLPVGRNLQDQFGTQLSFTIKKNIVSNAFKEFNLMNLMRYLLYSDGILSSSQTDVVGFVNTNNQSDSVPNIQIIVKPFSIATDSSFKKLLGINDNLWQKYENIAQNKDTIAVEVRLLHPKSRGIVLLSSDEKRSPKIDPLYYSDKEDLVTLREGLKLVDKLIESKPLMFLRAESFGEPKECLKHKPKSNEFYECFARYLTLGGQSPIGTCRMGDPSGEDSVVDSQLRVHGIDGLRVADASVMPAHTSGGPMAAVMMIGQRMANILIERDGQVLKDKFNKLENLVENGFQIAYKLFNKYYGL